MVDLILPFRNTLKRAKIEPLIIPQEKLQELKNILADPNLPETHKSMMISRISGRCHSCGQMATQIAKYRMFGVTIIEKYVSSMF